MTPALQHPNTPALQHSNTPALLFRFSRLKGSGTFSLDEFCALTGLPSARSLKVLAIGERQGLVLCLASGFYILKPASCPSKKTWTDWTPPRAKLQAFLNLIPKKGKIENRSLIAASGLSKTAAARYLRILKFTGNIRKIRQGACYWQRLSSSLAEIPSWHQVTGVPASGVPASRRQGLPASSPAKSTSVHSRPLKSINSQLEIK